MKKVFSLFKWFQYLIIIAMLGVNIFIIVNACLPGNASSEISSWPVEVIKDTINTIKEDTINESNIVDFTALIRKLIGHFSLFGLSGILTTLSIKFIYYNKKEKLLVFLILSSISGLFLGHRTRILGCSTAEMKVSSGGQLVIKKY